MGALPGHREPVAASGLRLLSRDFAKLGQLVLAHGVWQGKQLAPAAFVEQATTPHINGQQLYFYGYQFWLGRSFVRGDEIDWSAAVGLGGQRVFVVPALDLVAVVNAGLYRSPMQAWVPLVVLNRYVLAAAHWARSRGYPHGKPDSSRAISQKPQDYDVEEWPGRDSIWAPPIPHNKSPGCVKRLTHVPGIGKLWVAPLPAASWERPCNGGPPWRERIYGTGACRGSISTSALATRASGLSG